MMQYLNATGGIINQLGDVIQKLQVASVVRENVTTRRDEWIVFK
jgi:hypothetical protein